MGLSEFFGFEQKGSIGIETDKQEYFPGEVVAGKVYLEVRQPITCNSIVLKVYGKEEVGWQEQSSDGRRRRSWSDDDDDFVARPLMNDNHFSHRTTMRSRSRHSGHHRSISRSSSPVTRYYRGSQQFFSVNVVLYHIKGGVILPGNYLYPFRYQLPMHIPKSYDLSQGLESGAYAYIHYKMKATVDVAGLLARDLKAKRTLIIKGQPPQSAPNSTGEAYGKVRFLCCFHQGIVHIQAAMDKSLYLPGEQATVTTLVENNSGKDVRQVQYKLVRHVTLRSDGGRSRSFRTVISETPSVGVPSGKHAQLAPTMKIGGRGIQPTLATGLMNCDYDVVVNCDIAWCPDVAVELPITLLSPEIVPSPQYSGWMPQNTDQYVPTGEPVFYSGPKPTDSIPMAVPVGRN